MPALATARFLVPGGARLQGQDIGLLVQRLGDGTARVHVDIHTGTLDDGNAHRWE
jgi:hypothetical protein